MKLPVDNSGRRFFPTFCARERRPVFSHVVAKLDRDDGESMIFHAESRKTQRK